jgi:hypothetical protein
MTAAVAPGREALLEAALRKLAIRQGVRLASGGGDVPNGGRCVLCRAEWDEPFKDNEWHQSGCLFHEDDRLAAKPADEPDSDAMNEKRVSCVLLNQIEIMSAVSLLLRCAAPELIGKAGELDQQRDDLLQRHKATQSALSTTGKPKP